MYKLNDIALETYGILPGRVPNEGIAIRGLFDMPKRIGDVEHSWDDEDSVEAFVAPDELFFGGRDLLFQGLMMGDAATLKTNLDTFKTAISSFVNTVPLETPYGDACVYVKKITTRSYFGGALLQIEFIEPIIGGVCGLNVLPTVYYSAEYSDTAIRNNCDDGFHGTEVVLTAYEGQFTSTISQQAADQLAIDWVLDSMQVYANVNGVCEVDPTVYYNVKIVRTFTRNNCASGYQGTTLSYTVPAYTYSSLESQAAANALAVADADAHMSQAIANATGLCQLVYYSAAIGGQVQKNNCGPGYIGTIVIYPVPGGLFTSTLSQAYANALAQAYWNANSQAYANEVGSCVAYNSNSFRIDHDFDAVGFHLYDLKVGTLMPVGSEYVIKFHNYGSGGIDFTISYQVQNGDTLSSVILGLRNVIVSKSHAGWDALCGTTMYSNSELYPSVFTYTADVIKIQMFDHWRIIEVWVTV